MTERLEEIAIDNITVGEQQVRHDTNDEELEELALDIQANGLLQPIGVWQIRPGTYQLRFGSRRLAAHRLLRRTTVRALVNDGTMENVKADAVRENIHRRAMTLREECEAVTHLEQVEKKSVEEIRTIMGKSRAWVQGRLLIPTLPIEISDAVLDGRLTILHAEILAGIEDPGLQAQLLQHVQNERWTTALLRQAIDNMSGYEANAAAVSAGLAQFNTPSAPVQIHFECHACRRPRLPQDLITIKVCANGCEPAEPSGTQTKPGQETPAAPELERTPRGRAKRKTAAGR